MSNTITNEDSVIDSRDIISRIEELEGDFEAHLEECAFTYPSEPDSEQVIIDCAKDSGHALHDDACELIELRKVAEQCEGYGDWEHGETLVNESYFTQYTEELIKDCYEMPKEMDSGNWPFNHMTMDYDAAAEELKSDYTEVNFSGTVFFMRA